MKRANGEGSVFKMPNGKWRAVCTMYYDGERRQVTKSGFRTKREAAEYLVELRSELASSEGKAKIPYTFGEIFENYMSNVERGHQLVSSYRCAMAHFSRIVDWDIRDIGIDDLQDAVNNCPAGKATRTNMRTVAGLIYKHALPRLPDMRPLNLAQFIIINEGTPKAARPSFTSEQLSRIQSAIGRVPYAEHIFCHCYLGFRPTAFLGMTEADYNPDEKCFVGGIKTEAGRNRTVTVSPKIQRYVDDFLKLGGKTVFCDYTGKPLSAASYGRKMAAVLEKLGIDNPTVNGRATFTPHSCRHTFATLMKRADGSNKDKLALIGHANTSQLLDYQDVVYEDLRKITDSL